MPDSALLTGLTSAGVAGIFCILFICGFIFPRAVVTDLKTEVTDLKAALEAERQRAATSVAAATATRDILTAIQGGHYDPGRKQ